MKLYPLLLCGLLAACSSQSPSEQTSKSQPSTGTQASQNQAPQDVKLKGEFAQIDVAKSQQAMDAITGGNGDIINDILKSPNDYAPPVLYLISAIMFDNDYQEQATFWFYAAQLRARSDANKSADNTAHAAVSQLNQRFGAKITPYAMSNPDRLKAIVNQVLEWDGEQNRNYDARWIALQSKDVLTESKVNFAPRDKWQEINVLTRNQFRQGLEQALAKIKSPGAQ
ncbi:hypothetical protein GCM10011502_24690 [Oceanisphaera marina]|uniref:Lipoprotein n=1 Tax=Oceanisphaera marina TaxID=2017550 RepID=A0ABQ1IT69_9GAMM|nr:hypothetical protein [Oceanisphaera marina]GGB50622.1 hypothetical protein GCM10011502_24690 [Oceanisphaera marina]